MPVGLGATMLQPPELSEVSHEPNLAIKAIAGLHRSNGRYALVTMCIGAGQGIAAIFERI